MRFATELLVANNSADAAADARKDKPEADDEVEENS